MRNTIIGITIVFLLSACSFFSPVKNEPVNSYVLNTLPEIHPQKSRHRISVLVTEPTASEINNTTQMAYTIGQHQVAYFAKNRWAETPAQMLQSLLIQTFQNTKYFYAVESPPITAQYDYVINTQLLQFEQQFFKHSSDVVITLRVQVIKTNNNTIVASNQFTVREPTPENTPYGGVVAANQAAAKLTAQIVKFCFHIL
jgi:cholesterol transport system auxiliary component